MKLVLPDLLRRLRLRPGPTSAVLDKSPPGLSVPDPEADCRRLRAVIEAADDGLLACDGDGRLTLVNPAAAALLEIEPRRAGPGGDWPAGALMLRPALERALADGCASAELEIERGGRKVLLEGRANPTLTEDGQVDGAVLVLRDITRLRELVAARADSWEALAHDLKTPLNSIGGFTTLLLQEAVGPLNPLQRDFLWTIEQEGQRLLQAVQGFLEEARSGGEERLSLEELRLRTVVDETVDRLRSLAVRKGLTIDVQVPADLPTVEADREKIGHVLMNLLDNAISFSPEGSRIEISAREVGDCLEVAVADEGVGIPPDCLPLVFGRFYRAPNQPSGSRPGVGLGLAICKQLVEQHGGRIWAESDPQGGARLAFSLPVAYRQARLEVLGAAL